MEGNQYRQTLDKRTILGQLRAARSAQLHWRACTQVLTSSAEGSGARAPAMEARKRFSHWHHSAARQLGALRAFQSITTNHQALLQIDTWIFDVLFPEEEPHSFIGWFRSPVRDEHKRLSQARDLLSALVSTSAAMLKDIDALEREVKSMTNDELRMLQTLEFSEYERNFIIN